MLWRFLVGGFLVVISWCTPGGAQFENSTYKDCGLVEDIGDGWCDPVNNIDSCSYDGGDCCSCSCMDELEYECGLNGFDCKDDACLDRAVAAQFPNCTGNLLKLADGACDRDNNTPSCGYDDGDCCVCTSVNSIACTLDFNCVDPDAGDELYECKNMSLVMLSPCSDDVEKNWIVEDTAQARTLAEATKCSGGSFQVEWRGNISTDETIYAIDGTVLHIYGTHAGATMSGNLENRLITVVNASLYLENITVEFGSALVGGAIASSSSSLTLNHTSFVGNHAGRTGGALYATDQSTVLFVGESTRFSNNSAYSSGGALHVAGGSGVSWKGRRTFFTENLSHGDGGAVTIRGETYASWSGEMLFSNNTCGRHGGALYTRDHSSVTWNGATYFMNNTARVSGGAVSIFDGSTVSWRAEMGLDPNFADLSGNGLFEGQGSIFSLSGETRFDDNRAGFMGGAISVYEHSDVFGSGDTTYARNSALDSAGAISVLNNCTISWSGKTRFSSNTAETSNGGALVVQGRSQAFWSGTATFISNSARDGAGGAIYLTEDSTASWKSEATFTRSIAGTGGAVYAEKNSTATFNGRNTFDGNVANNNQGGAMVLKDHSAASWKSEATFTKNTAAGGGAVFIGTNSTISFDGETTFDGNVANTIQGGALSIESSNVYFRNDTVFVGNTAKAFGGAVAFVAEISSSNRGSPLTLQGFTSFRNNTCEANGGALGLIGGVLIKLERSRILFFGNRAAIAGGAIYMWGNDLGPEFIEVSFVSNFAQHGGGVYSTGSGNALIGLDGEQRSNPVVLVSCSFIGNQAIATGGAIHSAAGQDTVIGTTFNGNTASEGGALNLAGTSTLQNCSFVENVSDEGRGPVIANIGYVSSISNCFFLENAFSCEEGEFLGFNSVSLHCKELLP